MKRLGYAVLALACAAAGALTSVVLAGGVGAAGFLTGTTTGTTSTGTTTTPLPTLIAPGVTISGIPVGGMTVEEAGALVRQRYDVRLHEHDDLHNWVSWRDTFHPHLVGLLERLWG